MESEQPNTTADESPPAEKRGRGPGKPFVANDPRLRQNLDKEEPSDRTLVEDMRAIYAGKPTANNSATRALRKQFKTDPVKFICRLEALEKAAAAKPPSSGAPDGQVAEEELDEGDERLGALIDNLLDGYGKDREERERVAEKVSRHWNELSAADQQTILGIVERARQR